MSSSDPELERRLEALETKYAYQEETVSNLSGLVWDLQRKADRLEALVVDLGRKMSELENPAPNPPADQKPPHY